MAVSKCSEGRSGRFLQLDKKRFIIDSRGRVAPGIGNCDVIKTENLKLCLKPTNYTEFYNGILIVDVHGTILSIK